MNLQSPEQPVLPIPTATQSYHPDLKPENRIRRSAVCPLHKKQSLDFLGWNKTDEGKPYWSFSCHALSKEGHAFSALPDKKAPSTAEGLGKWIREQMDDKLRLITRTQS